MTSENDAPIYKNGLPVYKTEVGGLFPTKDHDHQANDGIEGHVIPAGWVDDGVSPYPWMEAHDPMFASAEEAQFIMSHPSHPLAKPLPSSVWMRYFVKQAEGLVATLDSGTSSKSPRRDFVNLAEDIRLF